MRPRAMRQSSPGRPKVWSPCACVTKILSTSAGRTMQRCSWTCVPSPVSKSQKESFTCVGNGAAQASPAGSPEGRFQRQTMLQAIPSFGQPRPISRLGRAGRLYRPCFFTRPRTRSARAEALRKGDGLHAPLPRIVISTSTPLLPCSLIWAAGWTLDEAAGGCGEEGTLGAARLFGCAAAGAAASARC